MRDFVIGVAFVVGTVVVLFFVLGWPPFGHG
jgi:hypothetical protein